MSLVIEEETIERLPINIDPEIMSGTPVFEGTRVPVEALAVLKFSNETLRKLGSPVEDSA